MATGVVAVGATVYALLLRSDYVVKKNTLDQISLGAENPVLPGTIDNADTYNRYKAAYADAQAAGKKQGVYVASVGLAVVATLAEMYLLRNSSKRVKKMITWKPSGYSVGLAFSYTF